MSVITKEQHALLDRIEHQLKNNRNYISAGVTDMFKGGQERVAKRVAKLEERKVSLMKRIYN